MKIRTKLKDRKLPDYTRGEEVFNMVSHIVGGGLGIIALVLCVVISVLHDNLAGVITSIVYGVSIVLLYTMSSIYHGLKPPMAKKVFQILDHCTIYLLIAGTYTPLLICAIRKVSPTTAWVLLGVIWALTVLAVTFTAIDLKSFKVFSMICYIGMGWCVIFAIKTTYIALSLGGFLFLLAGGIFYTIGAVLYGIGKKKRYIHSVFHLFVVLGSIAHFLCIVIYVL